MIALSIFLISLIFALLALLGWPVEADSWTRSLIASASVMMGVAAMFLLTPLSRSRRFTSRQKPQAWNQLAGMFCIAAVFGLLCTAFVFVPPAASQFSDRVITAVHSGLSMFGGNNKKTSLEETDPQQGQGDVSQEIGAMFDPNGAVVPKAADLAPSNEPAISLKLSDKAAAAKLRNSGQIYLHLFSHHVFDGERWTSYGGDGPLYISSDSDGLIHLAKTGQQPDYQYTILHHELSSGLDALCTLQGVHYVRLPEITQLNAGTWLLPRPDNALGVIRPYEAASSPERFRDLLAEGQAIKPGNAGAAHLAPSGNAGLDMRIRELAAGFRKNRGLEQQLADVQGWLSNSFGYTLKMDYPDKQKTALESFLSRPGESEGFCVHFASAAVLILRELGVPARMSYGWSGGEYYREHGQFVFRAEHGHAWAEMFLEDHGWVVFETTPGTALPRTEAASAGATPPAVQEYSDPDSDGSVQRKKGVPLPLWRWVVTVLGAAFAALLALLLIKRRKLVWNGHDSAGHGATPPPDYVRLFHQACTVLGHPKPAGCTLRQHLAQLEGEEIPIPFAEELLTYHYGVTYRGAPRDSRHEKQLCRQIKAL